MGTNQKIRVCHLVSGDLWAGAEVQMFTLLKALSNEQSLDLSAIVLNPGELAERLKEIGIDVVALDESKDNFFQLRRKIIKILRYRKTDIIHSHRYKENVLAGSIKKKCGVGYLIQNVHGISERFKGFALFKARIYSAINRIFTRRYFDKIIAVSDDIKQLLREIYPQSHLITIHNAVDPIVIISSKTAEDIRREFNIDFKAPIIGVTGRMAPVKAYDLFLRAANIILDNLPAARFMLVGDGPYRPSLQELSVQLKIADRVIFTGFRTDIFDIINTFDIFVISSHHEGVPMALLEAMSLKKPIVSTAVGGINEVIEDGVSGLLVEPNSAVDLAGACLKILNDPVLKSTMEDGAYARIEKEFNIEVQAKKVLALYRELII
jgi:glycosyltransferase involved in cell wall biosynthesis